MQQKQLLCLCGEKSQLRRNRADASRKWAVFSAILNAAERSSMVWLHRCWESSLPKLRINFPSRNKRLLRQNAVAKVVQRE
jgi:hypothetical protein